LTSDNASLPFERARFRTRLPREYRYTAGHLWLAEVESGLWRVGLTRFALRMLGDAVDMELQADEGAAVEKGQVVGWVEGFKAVSDLFAPMAGHFVGGNPELETSLDLVERSAQERGWLYALRGEPDEDCVDAQGYARLLAATIDRYLESEG